MTEPIINSSEISAGGIEYPVPWSQIHTIHPFTETFLVTSGIVLFLFTIVHKGKILSTPKQLSWFITFFNSTILSFCSLFFIYDLIQNPSNLDRFGVSTPFSIVLTSFFVTTLFWDCVLGAIFYPGYIDLITGWLHHVAIFLLCLTQFYCLMCPMEAPTIFLSLGSMNKKLRRDWIFGSLFFVTRIVYHLYSIITWYTLTGNTQLVAILIAFYPMHVIWFRGFILQQIRLFKNPHGDKKSQTNNPLLNSFNGVDSANEERLKGYFKNDQTN
ncbi:hypothetical protein CONCODRAFT_80254 [Conidiobolus coronatus NRRL 28638]|uniref:TLC domain-containing protein n=1 Tax=Conidiobolus coronatus (strain ATCC 28846 / CBS 209.66 / NRRL 28638) TaxID=796925 RepID=A0A137NX27_CONC2|nr:hypothetical protein CONCODRAFT_80254 [Conidiobolus coronatus NRRL 28638]|eukprot:KXN67189.1 hypothetical protein CONCODRAFT_80254 [Conidiobolus coronatus NRRL 28638]